MEEKRVITVKNLKASYAKKDKFEIKDISFYLNEGEVLGILGKNGSGKTTLLECLTRFMEINSGCIEIFGRELNKELNVIWEDLAYVTRNLTYGGTCRINTIAKYWNKFYKKYSHERFLDICKRLELDTKKKIHKLSQGEKIIFYLAMALARTPKLLIMDEPFSNLDPIIRMEVMQLLRDYMDEYSMSIIYSTHMIHELEQIADRILYLDHGIETYFGDVNQIQDEFFKDRRVDLNELFENPKLNVWIDEEYELYEELEKEALEAGGEEDYD